MWMGACQATESLLSALGNSCLELLLPVDSPESGQTGLGLATSGWTVTEIEPVLVRWKDEKSAEILVGAQTLAERLEPTTAYAIRDLGNRARCRVGGSTLRLRSITGEWCDGNEYLYRFLAEV